MASSAREEAVARECHIMESWSTCSTGLHVLWTTDNISRHTTRNSGTVSWISNHIVCIMLFYILQSTQTTMADGHTSTPEPNLFLKSRPHSNSLTLCTDDTCRFGQCYVVGKTTKCFNTKSVNISKMSGQ